MSNRRDVEERLRRLRRAEPDPSARDRVLAAAATALAASGAELRRARPWRVQLVWAGAFLLLLGALWVDDIALSRRLNGSSRQPSAAARVGALELADELGFGGEAADALVRRLERTGRSGAAQRTELTLLDEAH